MSNHQPRTRQEIYDRIKESSKDEFIREEMIRFGFWDEDIAKASEPEKKAILEKIEQIKQELNELQIELNNLESEKTLSKNLKQKIRELQKEKNKKIKELKKQIKEEKKARLIQSKIQRQETKEKRETERKEKAEAWLQRREKEILYLGEEVSQGLDNKDNNLERLENQKLPVFSTAEDIAQAMNITVSELRFLTFNRSVSSVSHYIRFKMPKKTGGERLISAPKPKLKKAQYWILNNILEKIVIHDSAHGFYKQRSIVTNATPHVGAKIVINFDLKDFFPSISYKRIKGLFRSLGYSEFVATIFALICTEAETTEVEMDGKTYYVAEGERHLPQGSPASPSLTNILCRRLDRRLQKLAHDLGFEYTRYADDLTFSTAVDNPTIAKLFRNVESIVTHEGLTINDSKTRILRANKQQEVTGIVVNDKLNIDRKTLKNFRALLFQIEQDVKQNPLNPLKGFEGKKWGNTDNIMASIKGFVNFVIMVNPEKGAKLKTILNRIINPTEIIEPPVKILHPIEEQNSLHSNKKDVISRDSSQKIEPKDINLEILEEEKSIILECYKKGKDLKIRVISAGYNQDWNVRFPNNLKEEGARYSVEEIKESSRKYYTVSGIKKLTSEIITVSPENIDENKTGLSPSNIIESDQVQDNPQNIDDLDNQIIQTPEVIKTISLQDAKNIVLECYKKGKDLKVRVISDGYNQDWNVRFPQNLKEEGAKYLIDEVKPSSRNYYTITGTPTKLSPEIKIIPVDINLNETTLSSSETIETYNTENLDSLNNDDNQTLDNNNILNENNATESVLNNQEEKTNLQCKQGAILECYKKGKNLKVRVISEGYNSGLNVRFPRDLREEGVYYHVETIEEIKGKYYVAKGTTIKINEDLDSFLAKNKENNDTVQKITENSFQDKNNENLSDNLSFEAELERLLSEQQEKDYKPMWVYYRLKEEFNLTLEQLKAIASVLGYKEKWAYIKYQEINKNESE